VDIRLENIYVRIKFQGHLAKVKVTAAKNGSRRFVLFSDTVQFFIDLVVYFHYFCMFFCNICDYMCTGCRFKIINYNKKSNLAIAASNTLFVFLTVGN